MIWPSRNCRQLLFVIVLSLLVVTSAHAKDWFVNNVGGNDLNDGATEVRPFKTIAFALKKATQGDRVILANTGTPYRETITLSGSNKSGTGLKPFFLIGNGATLDGRKTVSAKQWEHFDGDVFRFRPERMSFQLIYRDDKPAPRGKITDPKKAAQELAAGEWAQHRGWVYFRVEPHVDPIKYNLSYCSRITGITMYRVENVVITDLVIQGFQLDGINCHDLTRKIIISGVTSRGNGRSGIFVGGASRCVLEGCTVGDNGSAQVQTNGFCKLDVRECHLIDSEQYGDPLVVKGGKVTVDGEAFKK